MNLCPKAKAILAEAKLTADRTNRSAECEGIVPGQVTARKGIAKAITASAASAVSRHMDRCPLCSK